MRRYTYYENKKWRIKVGDTELTGPWVDRLSYYEEIAPDPEAMRDEAYDLGYRSCLHYKGLTWDEAKELQAYRKTGLTVERAAELGKADQEGRVFILPCKAGDRVYVNRNCLINSSTWAGKNFVDCEVVNVRFGKREISMYLRPYSNPYGRKRYHVIFGITSIGKTVFLTREEAEKVL